MTKPGFVANFISGRAESSLLVNHAAKASNCSAGLCRAFPGILRCPVRSAGMISMPAIVPRTAQNHWNPSIGRTIRFPALWALVRHSESHKQFIFWEASDHLPAHGLGHPQLGHTIEHRAFYPRFRALRVKAPRPEVLSYLGHSGMEIRTLAPIDPSLDLLHYIVVSLFFSLEDSAVFGPREFLFYYLAFLMLQHPGFRDPAS